MLHAPSPGLVVALAIMAVAHSEGAAQLPQQLPLQNLLVRFLLFQVQCRLGARTAVLSQPCGGTEPLPRGLSRAGTPFESGTWRIGPGG